MIALDSQTRRCAEGAEGEAAVERALWGDAYEDSDLVFARENGTPLHPDLFSDAFWRHVAAAKLPRIRFQICGTRTRRSRSLPASIRRSCRRGLVTRPSSSRSTRTRTRSLRCRRRRRRSSRRSCSTTEGFRNDWRNGVDSLNEHHRKDPRVVGDGQEREGRREEGLAAPLCAPEEPRDPCDAETAAELVASLVFKPEH